jgi:uncharacterized protein (DUF302 family)
VSETENIKKYSGLVDRASNHSVDQTVDRLKSILQAKGVTLFALIDHSGEAEKVGMTMRPTKLLVFGAPKAGTPLMLACSSRKLDLWGLQPRDHSGFPIQHTQPETS